MCRCGLEEMRRVSCVLVRPAREMDRVRRVVRWWVGEEDEYCGPMPARAFQAGVLLGGSVQ